MKVRFTETDAVTTMEFLDDGILAHVVNDQGVMGAGIALAIAKAWPKVNQSYIKLVDEKGPSETFGRVLFVPATEELIVANMFAQKGLGIRDGQIPLQYDWLQSCLDKVFDHAIEQNKHIHIPRIGAGLAGGNWDKIWYMILSTGYRKKYQGELVLHQFVPKINKLDLGKFKL